MISVNCRFHLTVRAMEREQWWQHVGNGGSRPAGVEKTTTTTPSDGPLCLWS